MGYCFLIALVLVFCEVSLLAVASYFSDGQKQENIQEIVEHMPRNISEKGLKTGQSLLSGEIISKKDNVLDRGDFEKLKDEFYTLRGWDVTTGLQTKAKLEELGLGEIATDLETKGLVV